MTRRATPQTAEINAAFVAAGKQVPTAPFPSGCTDPKVGSYCATSKTDCTTFHGTPAFVGAAGDYVGGAARRSCEAAFEGNYHWNGQVQKLNAATYYAAAERLDNNLTGINFDLLGNLLGFLSAGFAPTVGIVNNLLGVS